MNENFIALMASIPHYFYADNAGEKPEDVRDEIRRRDYYNGLRDGLIPVYGYFNEDDYSGSCKFLLFEPETGKFYEISGSHCSCGGYEGQFEPEECPLEYIRTGKPWEGARETVEQVLAFMQTIN